MIGQSRHILSTVRTHQLSSPCHPQKANICQFPATLTASVGRIFLPPSVSNKCLPLWSICVLAWCLCIVCAAIISAANNTRWPAHLGATQNTIILMLPHMVFCHKQMLITCYWFIFFNIAEQFLFPDISLKRISMACTTSTCAGFLPAEIGN